jgi:hypothetical protein
VRTPTKAGKEWRVEGIVWGRGSFREALTTPSRGHASADSVFSSRSS